MISDEISLYDRGTVVPREAVLRQELEKEHAEMRIWIKEVQIKAEEALKTIHEWQWPLKIMMAMISATLLGVIALVYDFIRWGIANNWHYH